MRQKNNKLKCDLFKNKSHFIFSAKIVSKAKKHIFKLWKQHTYKHL